MVDSMVLDLWVGKQFHVSGLPEPLAASASYGRIEVVSISADGLVSFRPADELNMGSPLLTGRVPLERIPFLLDNGFWTAL